MTFTAPPPATSFLRRQLAAGQTQFYLSRLHSLTGILFGGYLMIHLVINASLVEGYRPGAGQTVYQGEVNALHGLPFLPLAKWVLIYLPILYHTVYGLWLTYRAKPNVNQYPFGRNIFYVFQRISAILLAAFIVFHMTALKGWWSAGLKFDPTRATESAVSHVNASWLIGWFVYPLGILAACYHLAQGLWTAGITWGITLSAGAQRRWGRVCVVIFAAATALGMTALIAALTQHALVKHFSEARMNSALIDAYEHSVQKIRGAVAGLSAEKMKAFPVPGTWSIQQIVIHVVDSDLVGADRMKRIIAMDNPPLPSYDETLFTQRMAYHEQSIDDALEIMRLNSRQMGRILRQLPEAALSRKGVHSEEGEISLKQMLERMIKHVDHHLKFIVDKRKMV